MLFSATFYRLLQGWDRASMKIPSESPTGFPHITLLPGLQFSLAGIIGKPETFYLVPAVRFFYETVSYM